MKTPHDRAMQAKAKGCRVRNVALSQVPPSKTLAAAKALALAVTK